MRLSQKRRRAARVSGAPLFPAKAHDAYGLKPITPKALSYGLQARDPL